MFFNVGQRWKRPVFQYSATDWTPGCEREGDPGQLAWPVKEIAWANGAQGKAID
jgi:hypothetical protein